MSSTVHCPKSFVIPWIVLYNSSTALHCTGEFCSLNLYKFTKLVLRGKEMYLVFIEL
jgi:hypothetical protein